MELDFAGSAGVGLFSASARAAAAKNRDARRGQRPGNALPEFHGGHEALGSKLRTDTLGAFGTCGRRNGFSQALWQA